MSYEVPRCLLRTMTQVAKQFRFVRELLDTVLTKDAQSRLVRLTDDFRRMSLAHAHKRYFGWASSSPHGGVVYPLPYPRDPLSDLHGGPWLLLRLILQRLAREMEKSECQRGKRDHAKNVRNRGVL